MAGAFAPNDRNDKVLNESVEKFHADREARAAMAHAKQRWTPTAKELKGILERHGQWVESDGKEGE